LIPPISNQIYNYKETAKLLANVPDNLDHCPCRLTFPKEFRPNEGCVWTGNLTVIEDDCLRKLISYGPNFREKVASEPLRILEESVKSFIANTCGNHTDPKVFVPWKVEFLRAAKERIDKLPALDHSAALFPQCKRTLRKLQKLLVFVPADKAPNNTIIVCKRLYIKTIGGELKDGSIYEVHTQNTEETIESLTTLFKPLNLPTIEALPILCGLPKMHKSPFSWRFLSLSGKCTNMPASRALSKLLTCISDTLRDLNDKILSETGIRRYFVLKDPFEASDFLASWRRTGPFRNLATFDFSTMYTNIPLLDLCSRLDTVIDEAVQSKDNPTYEWMLQVHLQGGFAQSANWVDVKRTAHTTSCQIFSLPEVKQLIRNIVLNTYVSNGDTVRRQIQGIPMGTNSAVDIANLYLYSYEAPFIDIVAHESVQRAREFNLTFRLLDDCLSADNAMTIMFTTPYEEGGIYPRQLTCNLTSDNTDHVTFCGLFIESDNNSFRISVYDKKKDFPFEVKSYPHTDSNIPNSIAYSAFVGQLHRFYRVSSTSSLFLRDAVELACYLIMNNGCKQELLIRKFYSFCRKVVRSKYDLKLYTLRQMFVNDVPARLFHLHSPTSKSLFRYITSDTRDASHVPPLGDLDKQMNLFLGVF
jgi:hypothetical protein